MFRTYIKNNDKYQTNDFSEEKEAIDFLDLHKWKWYVVYVLKLLNINISDENSKIIRKNWKTVY